MDIMKIKIGLIGKGNVGTHFLQILNEREAILRNKFEAEVIVVAIFELDGALINKNGLKINEILNCTNIRELSDWEENKKFNDYVSAISMDIIIETTPTNHKTGEPGLSHIIVALKNNINVISSNKGPFYLKYKKIKNLAEKMKKLVKYEATVASCVPILSIKENLIGNEIFGIRAILNGTSNYILSRMTAEGIAFTIALKEAQELGYAETNPKLDIEGYDAAGKLVIIANQLLNLSKTINDVEIKGITSVTPEAIELAKLDGYVIKQLAIAEDNNLIVEPRLVEKDSPLNIGGTLNVIELITKYAGSIILIGRGAGGFEAASAIFNDFISVIKEMRIRNYEF